MFISVSLSSPPSTSFSLSPSLPPSLFPSLSTSFSLSPYLPLSSPLSLLPSLFPSLSTSFCLSPPLRRSLSVLSCEATCLRAVPWRRSVWTLTGLFLRPPGRWR